MIVSATLPSMKPISPTTGAHNDQCKAVPAADRQRQDNRYSHATPTMDCNPIAPFGAKTAVLATIAGGIVMRGFFRSPG